VLLFVIIHFFEVVASWVLVLPTYNDKDFPATFLSSDDRGVENEKLVGKDMTATSILVALLGRRVGKGFFS